jgi:hypothetical protein
MAEVLKRFNIPVSDRIRRQALFKALDQLCSSSAPDQFRQALQSQIHDESARMLIIKALAEQDGETLNSCITSGGGERKSVGIKSSSLKAYMLKLSQKNCTWSRLSLPLRQADRSAFKASSLLIACSRSLS